MNVYKTLIVLISVSIFGLSQAATFTVSNFSGQEINVQIEWNKSFKVDDNFKKGQKRKYNTWTARIEKIRWRYISDKQNKDESTYEVDLSNINTALKLNKEFAIQDKGYYSTNLTDFAFVNPRVEKAKFLY